MSNDAITDVPGLAVGHFTHAGRATGCSVVLCPQGAVAGVDVRGGAPGTRETDLLRPQNTVDRVHAILLTGGSAFGLDAAGGVMRWLEERGFESLWVPEHTHIPSSRKTQYPAGGGLIRPYYEIMDPFLALNTAATVTTRLKVGTGIALVI